MKDSHLSSLFVSLYMTKVPAWTRQSVTEPHALQFKHSNTFSRELPIKSVRVAKKKKKLQKRGGRRGSPRMDVADYPAPLHTRWRHTACRKPGAHPARIAKS